MRSTMKGRKGQITLIWKETVIITSMHASSCSRGSGVGGAAAAPAAPNAPAMVGPRAPAERLDGCAPRRSQAARASWRLQ
jgi:hypothetical protein